MRRSVLFVLALAAALMLVPASAVADPNNETMTFDLVLSSTNPSAGVAPNGDRVLVRCAAPAIRCGTFGVHPKFVQASGEFVHTDSEGTVLGGGTWVATKNISFEFTGCGVVTFTGAILPPNFCGGVLKLEALITAGSNQFTGFLTVFCIIGPQVSGRVDEPLEEGVTLVIPGVINFNQADGGSNRYERTS